MENVKTIDKCSINQGVIKKLVQDNLYFEKLQNAIDVFMEEEAKGLAFTDNRLLKQIESLRVSLAGEMKNGQTMYRLFLGSNVPEFQVSNLEVINGKIMVPMVAGPAKQIDLEKLQSILENDIVVTLQEVILSISQITCELIRNYSDLVNITKMQDMFPSADNLWMLNQISEVFRNEY